MIRFALLGFLLGSVLAAGPALAAAGCDSSLDLEAVANTRILISQQCDCAHAVSDGVYVRCAETVANDELTAGRLPRECRKVVVKCARKSTCGRPVGYHPCCRTNRLGKVKCKITTADRCRSGPGGSHCLSLNAQSCCDACTGPGTCSSPSGAFVDAVR